MISALSLLLRLAVSGRRCLASRDLAVVRRRVDDVSVGGRWCLVCSLCSVFGVVLWFGRWKLETRKARFRPALWNLLEHKYKIRNTH